jgi:ubiquinone/menaquinone biosynthesis C-methylase UbiE
MTVSAAFAMSSYVFMKVLESTPERYDRGIRILTRGRIDAIYERIAEFVARPGARILDIGCGTGGVSRACAKRGAHVVGIDHDAGMLEVARSQPDPATGHVEWMQLNAMEIEDRFEEESFDAIVSCLAFSEMSPDERRYVLKTSYSRMKPGGRIAIADEVPPETTVRRLWHRAARWPVAALTYAITQTTTHPVVGLVEAIRSAGFEDVVQERVAPGDFAVVRAGRGKG